MKKNLIAMAIFAASSGFAMAQSNVEVYGVIDMGLQSHNDGVNRTFSIDSGMANGTRLGFKGVEDLGNGLKAGFQLETGLEADTGGDSNFSGKWGEGTFVYLQGANWGKVTLGNQFTPLRNSLLSVDPFTTSYAGDARYLVGNGFPTFLKNSISYSSNNYGGFSGNVIYGAGEVPGSSSENRTIGFNVNYAQGPLTATLAYNKHNGTGFGTDKKDWLLGGTYDLGVAKLHAGYADHKEDWLKKRNYILGVSAPVGSNGKVLASYILSDVRNIQDADSKQLSVGYTHNLSKRTYLYSVYSHVSNDNNAMVKAAAPGKNASTLQAGIRHSF